MDEVSYHVPQDLEYQLIDFVTQEGHPETSSCFREETESRKRRAWDTPPISDTVFRDVRTYGNPRLYAYRTSARRGQIG